MAADEVGGIQVWSERSNCATRAISAWLRGPVNQFVKN